MTHAAQGQGQDGPAPVNTSASLIARPDDDTFDGLRTQRGSGSDREHPAGTYTGVAPGSGKPPVPIVPSKSPATITWPGFQMRPDGSSRVFVQSTTPLDPQPLAAAPGRYVIRLPGARVYGETNRLPLDTRFFNTPVTRVSVSVHRDGTQLQLDMRADVTPSLSSEPGTAGYYFTYIDLPRGQYIGSAEKPKLAGESPPPAAPPSLPPPPESARSHTPPASRPAFPPPALPPPEPTPRPEAKANTRATTGATVQASDDEAPPVIVKGKLKLGP